MTRPEEPSKYTWRWTIWSTVFLGVGVVVFFMGVTAGAPLWVSIALGLAVAILGGIGMGIVPRNPPKPGIHGKGSMPGGSRRQSKAPRK